MSACLVEPTEFSWKDWAKEELKKINLLICGDRNWSNYSCMRIEIENNINRINLIIEGDARGADKMAGLIAMELIIPFRKFPADWGKYYKAAGPIRNQQMLTKGNPHEVWAFHENIYGSKGTKDMVLRANKINLPIRIYNGFTVIKSGTKEFSVLLVDLKKK